MEGGDAHFSEAHSLELMCVAGLERRAALAFICVVFDLSKVSFSFRARVCRQEEPSVQDFQFQRLRRFSFLRQWRGQWSKFDISLPQTILKVTACTSQPKLSESISKSLTASKRVLWYAVPLTIHA